jgi:hypothetical protein
MLGEIDRCHENGQTCCNSETFCRNNPKSERNRFTIAEALRIDFTLSTHRLQTMQHQSHVRLCLFGLRASFRHMGQQPCARHQPYRWTIAENCPACWRACKHI